MAVKHVYRYIGCYTVGLKLFDGSAPDMYRNMWHWLDGTVALYVNISDGVTNYYVGKTMTLHYGSTLKPAAQFKKYCFGYICESPIPNDKNASYKIIHPPLFRTTESVRTILNLSLVQCPEGHVTRDFLSCEPQSKCGVEHPVPICPLRSDEDRMSINFTKHLFTAHMQDFQMVQKYVPMFACDQGTVHIAYSLVCDFKAECTDLSDEHFCQHITCPQSKCKNGQCLLHENKCDRIRHCFDSSDEVCWFVCYNIHIDSKRVYEYTGIVRKNQWHMMSKRLDDKPRKKLSTQRNGKTTDISTKQQSAYLRH